MDSIVHQLKAIIMCSKYCVGSTFTKFISVCSVCILLGACVSAKPRSVEDLKPVFTDAGRPVQSSTNKKLIELPRPKGKISAAVYGFNDLTGQNKPAPASGLSSAVTQGAVHILVKALLESGWFRPLERNGLQNVLTERNLWNQRLAQQGDGNNRLPAMPPATVIFDGGIIAYEFNLRSGGTGARILGIGASQQYREDTLTVNLRVINAQDGSIIQSVNSTKTIFSKTVNRDLFGYVAFDKLLELEGGHAYNEPIQRAVEEAIEAALIDLILQGIVNNRWQLAEASEINNPVFENYLTVEEIQAFVNSKKTTNQATPIDSSSSVTPLNKEQVKGSDGANVASGEAALSSGNVTASARVNSASDDAGNIKTAPKVSPVQTPPPPPPIIPSTAINNVGEVYLHTDSPAAVVGIDPEELIEDSNPAAKQSESQPEKVISDDNGKQAVAKQATQNNSPDITNSKSSGAAEEAEVKGVMVHVVVKGDSKAANEVYRAVDNKIDGVDVILFSSAERPGEYRVRVGRIETPEDADLVLGALRDMGLKELEVEQLFH